jgi:uncharacterized protein (DUF3084 family)
MAEAIKFNDAEVETLKEIQDSYFNIQGDFGRLSMTRIRIEQQLDSLSNKEDELQQAFQNTQAKETEFIDSINKKYGDGVYDPESGTFTPTDKK